MCVCAFVHVPFGPVGLLLLAPCFEMCAPLVAVCVRVLCACDLHDLRRQTRLEIMARDVRDAELTAGRARPYTGMPALSPERNDVQVRLNSLEEVVSTQMAQVCMGIAVNLWGVLHPASVVVDAVLQAACLSPL